MGSKINSVSDDFLPSIAYAGRYRACFIPDKFDNHGKWMDGWNQDAAAGGRSWCIIELGETGTCLVDMPRILLAITPRER